MRNEVAAALHQDIRDVDAARVANEGDLEAILKAARFLGNAGYGAMMGEQMGEINRRQRIGIQKMAVVHLRILLDQP